jgi:hypothetical protein
MLGKIAFSLLALTATVAVVCSARSERVRADETLPPPLVDSDDDMLPDCVEWAVMTSATNPDTDGDSSPDFVEVVQKGRPRSAGDPLPTDQEMRIVVTGPPPGSENNLAWMHLFVRVIEPGQLTSFTAWIEFPQLPGVRFSFDMLSLGAAVFRDRDAGAAGRWIQLSVPMLSTNLLQQLLPCSIQIESVLGGRQLRSGVNLFNVQGNVSTLVPFDQGRFAVQTIGPIAYGSGPGVLSNRVCLIELEEIGSGLGGTVYEVVDANCEDCNEIECSPNCHESVGWILTIPGGLQAISSQDN